MLVAASGPAVAVSDSAHSAPTPRSSGHRPRKRLGQHFLTLQATIDSIIAALAPQAGEAIIEIGPGLGALTAPLLRSGARLTAIELDRDLADQCRRRFADNANFRLICGDALAVDFARLSDRPDAPLRIIGNLPYNIATPLLFHLLEQANIVDLQLMLQRELAERMQAAPHSRTYGRLSVMVQYGCAVESLMRVPPHAFDPPPKVQSAVVRLRPKAPTLAAKSRPDFARLVRAAFSGRRKTLRNGLRGLLTAEAIEQAGIDSSLRPENLAVRDFVKLANCLTDSPSAIGSGDRPCARRASK